MGFLAVPPPYDFALATERFRALGPDLANLWLQGKLYRVVAGREVSIEPAPGGVRVEPWDARIERAARVLLGLDLDLAGFYAFAEAEDPVLARLARRLRGFRPPLAPDPLEALVTSITAQQISLRAALAIRNRLVQRLGERVGRAWAFPRRERLAQAQVEELVAVGLSRRKAESILGLARSSLDLDQLRLLSDEEARARLMVVPGVGEWTADWFLARHLGRPGAWPAGDLGLRKAVSLLYRGGASVTSEEVRAMGERLSPFQNLSAHYLLLGLRVLS